MSDEAYPDAAAPRKLVASSQIIAYIRLTRAYTFVRGASHQRLRYTPLEPDLDHTSVGKQLAVAKALRAVSIRTRKTARIF